MCPHFIPVPRALPTPHAREPSALNGTAGEGLAHAAGLPQVHADSVRAQKGVVQGPEQLLVVVLICTGEKRQATVSGAQFSLDICGWSGRAVFMSVAVCSREEHRKYGTRPLFGFLAKGKKATALKQSGNVSYLIDKIHIAQGEHWVSLWLFFSTPLRPAPHRPQGLSPVHPQFLLCKP